MTLINYFWAYSMSAFFSVVIPAYNRSDLLRSTVHSVLKQTYPDWECIIVNDGSTDNTVEVLNKEFVEDARCRIITQKNSERGVARNNGFNNSRGKYVVFLDSDDLLLPHHLNTLYSKIIEQNFPSFIATKFNFIRDGNIYDGPLANQTEGYYDYKFFLHGNPIACNVCVKKNNPNLCLFEEDRKYAIMEDWMFLIQNLRHDKMYLIDNISITMNDHADRSLRGNNKNIIEKTWLAIGWISRNADLTPADKEELQAHGNYFSAIHSYLDHDKRSALAYIKEAVKINGWQKKYLLLMAKSIIGRRIIQKITHR